MYYVIYLWIFKFPISVGLIQFTLILKGKGDFSGLKSFLSPKAQIILAV